MARTMSRCTGTRCAAIALAAVMGCGGGAGQLPNGGADGGAGGASPDGGGPVAPIVVPAECAPSSSGTVAEEISFRFTNGGTDPVWIGSTCSGPLFRVRSCIDGYQKDIARTTCNACDQAACRECPDEAAVCLENVQQVEPGGEAVLPWDTTFYAAERLGSEEDGCACDRSHAAPASKYRVRVEVFTDDPTGGAASPAYEVDTDFELPAAEASVEVKLDRGS